MNALFRSLSAPSTLGLFLLAAGCATPPDATPPAVALPDRWMEAAAAAPVAETAWWKAWGDPALDALMDKVLAGNLDLESAAARIRQARAERVAAGALGGPALDASASLRQTRTSGSSSASSGDRDARSFQAGLDLSWEADLFGRFQGERRAAEAGLEGERQALRLARVSLAAEAASGYATLRGLQERLRIAREQLDAQNQTLAITRRRAQAGLESGLDQANAEAQAATTAASLPRLEASIRQTVHALAFLCGEAPSALDALGAGPERSGPPPPPVPGAGVPSDLLRRRPDVLRAERALEAAAARVGVAAADFFPRFRIGAGAGAQNADPDRFFDPLREFWSAGPSVSWNLFDRGGTRAAVAVREALREQAMIDYRRVVLNAVREVEDALARESFERRRRGDLEAAAAASRRAMDLADTLYQAGEAEFLQVLTARRGLLAAEDALAQNTADIAAAVAELHRALGGGW